MTTTDPTQAAPNPSDSILMSLARAAMRPEATLSDASWPRLDLGDPRQREFGDYELLEEIGRGGMGVVYRARQRSLDRDVAIKFIAAGIADSFNVARFLGEARAAARLLHPNIVSVHEVGSIDGVHYFSMPLIRGRTLASLLDAGTLSPGAAIALMLKLCDAIGYAHRLGLLHLDLKPANVLLDERSEPLIADFGLARHMDDSGGVDVQEVSGTPSFMAPEQILIKQYRLTPATDLYALGAILYRCLGGVSPHGDGTPDELTQRAVAGRVRPLHELNPRVPRDLAAVAMKCLELLPRDRYGSVADLADDLRRARDGQPVSVRRIGAVERLLRWYRREPRLALATAAAACSLLLGASATAWQWQQAAIERDHAIAQRDLAEAARREAETERQRAVGSAELGAWLYADSSRSGSREANAEREARAKRMLLWLRARYPEEARQSAVLTAFVKALDEADTSGGGNEPFELLEPLVEIAGSDYRRDVVDTLLAGSDPQRHLLAARLVWFDEREDAEAPRFRAIMDQALASQPVDPLVWHLAAHLCTGPEPDVRCHYPEAARRLTEIDPNNAFGWIRRFIESEGDVAREALREAAQRERFEDYDGRAWGTVFTPFDRSGVPVPQLLSDIGRVLSPSDSPQVVAAMVEAGRMPLPAWQPFVVRCNPANRYFDAPEAYSDCLAVAIRMATARGSSLISNLIGVNVARRLARGTPLEQEMIEIRRRYLYVQEQMDSRGRAAADARDARRFFETWARDGELAAQAQEYGFPLQPPNGWSPADPRRLMLPEEREALDRAGEGQP